MRKVIIRDLNTIWAARRWVDDLIAYVNRDARRRRFYGPKRLGQPDAPAGISYTEYCHEWRRRRDLREGRV